MPGDPSPAQAEQPERDRGTRRRHDRARNPGAYPFGQRPGVHGEGSAEVASELGSQDPLHRTRISVGERLLRIVQQQVTGRVPERRDLLLTEGAPGAGRAVARALQHREATLLVRLQAAGTGCLADRKQQGAWKSGKPTTLPTFPHPRRRRGNYKTCRATLTISLVQIAGYATLTGLLYDSHGNRFTPSHANKKGRRY